MKRATNRCNLACRVFRRSGDSTNGPCSGDFDVCCRIECGRRSTSVTIEYEDNIDVNVMVPRIASGEDAEFAEFPWMLAVMQNKVYKCGASLIHPQVGKNEENLILLSGRIFVFC